MPNKKNHPRRYEENFKHAAAEFVQRTGQSVEESAAELGVDPTQLHDWTRKLDSQRRNGKPLSTMAQLRAENEALRNQVIQTPGAVGHLEDHSGSSVNNGLHAGSGVKDLYDSRCTAFLRRSLTSFWRSGFRTFVPHRSVR